jgi:hypothetical protein
VVLLGKVGWTDRDGPWREAVDCPHVAPALPRQATGFADLAFGALPIDGMNASALWAPVEIFNLWKPATEPTAAMCALGPPLTAPRGCLFGCRLLWRRLSPWLLDRHPSALSCDGVEGERGAL